MTDNTFAKPFNQDDHLKMMSQMVIHQNVCQGSVGCKACDRFSDFCEQVKLPPYQPILSKKKRNEQAKIKARRRKTN